MSPPKPSDGSGGTALPSLPPASQTARAPPKKKAAVDSTSFKSASGGGGSRKKSASSSKAKQSKPKSKAASSKAASSKSAPAKKGGGGGASSSSTAPPASAGGPNPASELRARQLRALERADAANRGLARSRAAERALREDLQVWTGKAAAAAGTTAPPAATANIASATGGGGLLVDDVSAIDAALAANGLTRDDVTPGARAALLEQARRYALELLSDARDLAVHACRPSGPSIEPRDLILASELRGDGPGVPGTLPSFRDASDVADEVNGSTSLPPVPGGCYGAVALPPREEQLTARTWDVVSAAGRRTGGRVGGGGGGGTDGTGGTALASAPPTRPSPGVGDGARPYGAARGRTIAVRLRRDGDAVAAGPAGGPGTSAVPVTSAAGGPKSAASGGQKKRGLKEL